MQTLIKLIESSYLLVSQALSYLLRTIKKLYRLSQKRRLTREWNEKFMHQFRVQERLIEKKIENDSHIQVNWKIERQLELAKKIQIPIPERWNGELNTR